MALNSSDLTVTMVDGTVYELHTIYADVVHYESTARKHKWGTISDSFVTAQGFISWRALKRTGKVDQAYEQWIELVDSIDRTDTGDEDDEVVPTPPGPGPG